MVSLDIDGTLGEYHLHFWRFACAWTGRDLPEPRWDDLSKVSFRKAIGMSDATYRQCKLAYRQGGSKRSMPVISGAAELTQALRRAGAEVWICTTRPYLRLDNIDPDTRHWARRNHITYHHMIYGEDKYRDLAAQVDNRRIVALLDDLPEQIDKALALGLDPILTHHPHNHWYVNKMRGIDLPRVTSLHVAREVILNRIKDWKESTVHYDN